MALTLHTSTMSSSLIETPRLFLRELSNDDIDFIAEMLSHREVMQYFPSICTREEAVAWIERQMDRYRHYGHGYWLVSERATGRPIGQAGLLKLMVDGREEEALGYMIHRPYWQMGYATESARAIIDYGFDVVGCERVVALIRPENTPSLGVAHKLAMQHHGYTVLEGFEHAVFYKTRASRMDIRITDTQQLELQPAT
jgi:RimJ/RimL family protein N-acetyltransferase